MDTVCFPQIVHFGKFNSAGSGSDCSSGGLAFHTEAAALYEHSLAMDGNRPQPLEVAALLKLAAMNVLVPLTPAVSGQRSAHCPFAASREPTRPMTAHTRTRTQSALADGTRTRTRKQTTAHPILPSPPPGEMGPG